MPDRIYRPARVPPSWVDRLLAHPGMTTTAGWWIVMGGIMTAQVVSPPSFEPSPSLAVLPALFALSVSLVVMIGGVLAALGLFWTGKMSTEWRMERAGWIVGAAGWASYGVAVVMVYPNALVSVCLAGTMVTAAVLRILALRRIEREIRARLKGQI